jgi:hypothetical protein
VGLQRQERFLIFGSLSRKLFSMLAQAAGAGHAGEQVQAELGPRHRFECEEGGLAGKVADGDGS